MILLRGLGPGHVGGIRPGNPPGGRQKRVEPPRGEPGGPGVGRVGRCSSARARRAAFPAPPRVAGRAACAARPLARSTSARSCRPSVSNVRARSMSAAKRRQVPGRLRPRIRLRLSAALPAAKAHHLSAAAGRRSSGAFSPSAAYACAAQKLGSKNVSRPEPLLRQRAARKHALRGVFCSRSRSSELSHRLAASASPERA